MSGAGAARVVVLAAALVLLAGCGERSAPRNVLLVTVDTLRADHLGAYGHPAGTSPEIDALLAGSIVFDDAQSSSSWTLPAFASLFTSLHAVAHGCHGYRSALDPSFTTLAETLKGHGYRTAGVVSHVFLRRKHGLPQGFDRFDDSLVESVSEAHSTVSSPYVTARALEHLDAFAEIDDDAPWLLWLHYFDPHAAYRRHEGISDRFPPDEEGRYDGEIAFTDLHVGRVLERLERLGLEDDTIVVFVSDHGEEFLEHGRSGHGKSLHREVVHVPLGLRVPGFPPRRVPEAVHVVDVAPTLLELLGVPWPAAAPRHGRSLMPALRGERLPTRPLPADLRLELRADATLSAVVFGRWKLIVENPRAPGAIPRPLLFDRDADEGETRDLARERPRVVERLRRMLDETLRTAARDRAGKRRSGGEVQLDAGELRNLESLGYVGGDEGG